MLDFASLITIATAFFIAAASPGPATLAVATVSMSAGRMTGLLFGLGLAVGLAFWGLVAATGLGAVLQASAHALMVLKVLGGLYLLWLAFTAARSAVQTGQTTTHRSVHRHHFSRGLLLNLSNPKAVLAWMAVLALGLGEQSSTTQVMTATALCMAMGLLIYTTYAFVFSMPGAMQIYRRTRQWIDAAVASLFALAGFSLLRSALAPQ